MKRSISSLFAVVCLLAGSCASGNVTLDFTFGGSSDCNGGTSGVSVDSVSYFVTDATGASANKGSVTCGDSANFSLGSGTYSVAAYAYSDGYCVGATSSALTVSGNGTFTVDFPTLSPSVTNCGS